MLYNEKKTIVKINIVLSYSWGDYGTPPATGSFAMQALIQNHYLVTLKKKIIINK